MKRTSLVLAGLLLVAGVTPALATQSATPSTPSLSGYAAKAGGTIIDAPIPTSILNTPLFDQNGKAFTLQSLQGKTVILTDFMTTCSDICPMTSANMREMGDRIAKLGLGKSVVGLELSIDAQRDTAPRLKAYQNIFGDSSWTLASGSDANLKKIWAWFGVYTKVVKADPGITDWQTGKPVTYDVDHDDVVIVIGPNLHWRWLDLGNPQVTHPTSATALPTTLRTFLTPNGKANLLKPEQPSWTTANVYSALNEIFKLKIGA
jgi:protein SCO1/2